MKIVNFPSKVYDLLEGTWEDMYRTIWEAFHELGYEVRVSPYFCSETIRPSPGQGNEYIYEHNRLNEKPLPDYVKVGIVDDPNHLYVFNHTYQTSIMKDARRGKVNFIIKPSGPMSKHFTIDTLGYASHSSITYQKPNFENTKHVEFYSTEVKEWINNKINKWDGFNRIEKFKKTESIIPKDHVLFLGQMPADDTVTIFSFGNHWEKFLSLLKAIDTKDPVVIKLHPTLGKKGKDGEHSDWYKFHKVDDHIKSWREKGWVVITGYDSIHDILPKTKVAIVENSTAGYECLMHNVPMISYGYPEYHWVTKDLRHAININEYINDISWYNEYAAKSWFTWYAKEYVCHDAKSSVNRLKQII